MFSLLALPFASTWQTCKQVEDHYQTQIGNPKAQLVQSSYTDECVYWEVYDTPGGRVPKTSLECGFTTYTYIRTGSTHVITAEETATGCRINRYRQ